MSKLNRIGQAKPSALFLRIHFAGTFRAPILIKVPDSVRAEAENAAFSAGDIARYYPSIRPWLRTGDT